MGNHLTLVLLATFLLMLGFDFFGDWYRNFLTRQGLPEYLQRFIEQLMWVLLSLLLWNTLYRRFLPPEFTISHLVFALFVFSLRGLAFSILRRH